MLAANIVEKECEKVGISADGRAVKASVPQGSLASRNGLYPCGDRKSIRIVAVLCFEMGFAAFTIL